MKKIILLITTMLMFSSAFAQFNLGIKGGITSSKLSTTLSDYNEETITGFYAGAFTRFYMNKVYIMPEAYFTSKGGNLSSTIDTKKHLIRIKSLDIPVLLGLQLLDLKVLKVSADIGPVASIVLDKEYDYKYEGVEIVNDDFYDHFKDSNWGLHMGAKLDVLMFMFEVKYEVGLNDIFNYDGHSLQNNVFLIGMGFKFL